MSSKHKTAARKNKHSQRNLKSSILAEIPVLPEKFFTFVHEGISMIWMDESAKNPVRGYRYKS